MIGFVVLACVLFTASLLFTFLILIVVGRMRIDQQESIDALIAAHNLVAQRVSGFDDRLDGALDCLVTLDAAAANSTAGVNVSG